MLIENRDKYIDSILLPHSWRHAMPLDNSNRVVHGGSWRVLIVRGTKVLLTEEANKQLKPVQ